MAKKEVSKRGEPTQAAGAVVNGVVVMAELDSVKPNSWNPNRRSERLMESIKAGFVEDGWVASEALAIWGTDEKGRKKNIIIDGEGRWLTGKSLGMSHGPMVFLERLTEAQAKSLTIKLDNKRGSFAPDPLTALVQELRGTYQTDDLALSLGFSDEQLMKMLAFDPETLSGVGTDAVRDPAKGKTQGLGPVEMGTHSDHVRMVQLFFGTEQANAFKEAARKLAVSYGTQNVTDTVYEAVIRAAAALGE